MALIRTLTISTTTFERMRGKFDGFRQTEKADSQYCYWFRFRFQIKGAKVKTTCGSFDLISKTSQIASVRFMHKIFAKLTGRYFHSLSYTAKTSGNYLCH